MLKRKGENGLGHVGPLSCKRKEISLPFVADHTCRVANILFRDTCTHTHKKSSLKLFASPAQSLIISFCFKVGFESLLSLLPKQISACYDSSWETVWRQFTGQCTSCQSCAHKQGWKQRAQLFRMCWRSAAGQLVKERKGGMARGISVHLAARWQRICFHILAEVRQPASLICASCPV